MEASFSNWLRAGKLCFGTFGAARLDAVQLQQICLMLDDEQAIDEKKGFADIPFAEARLGNHGALVILGEQAADWAALAAGLERLIAASGPGTRLVWLANPNAPISKWQSAALKGPVGTAELTLDADVTLPLTAEPDGYCLRLARGSVVRIGDFDAGQFGLEVSAAVGSAATAPTLGCGSVSIPVAPQTGAAQPCWLRIRLDVPRPIVSFDCEIPGGREQAAVLGGLGVGLEYAISRADGVLPIRFPVFAGVNATAPLQLSAGFTLGRLLDADATALRLLGKAPRMLSWFRTVTGKPVFLQPGAEFRLSFARRTDSDAGLQRLYLVPTGSCGLTVGAALPPAPRATAAGVRAMAAADDAPPADDNVPCELLACGSAGTEYVVLPKALLDADGCRLEFVAGKPAQAMGVAGSADSSGGPALAGPATTAWVRISAGEPLDYCSQPAGDAAMYLAGAPTAAKVQMLDYHPLSAASLPPTAEPGACYPMLPLAGIAVDEGIAAALPLEVHAVGPTRKAALGITEAAPVVRAAAAAKTFRCVTPRGLVSEFSQGANGAAAWTSVTIARILDGKVPGASGGIALQAIDGPLKAALLAAQQCIVISDPASLQKHLVDHVELTLEDWGFSLKPDAEHWGRHGTIFIVKNCSAPLIDLLRNPSAWTLPEAFNADVEATRARLDAIITDAQNRHGAEHDSEHPDFKDFVETILGSPDWNGFLFLNVAVTAPDALGGLKAGLDAQRFQAHHLGVTQRAFESIADLDTRSSSLFGLIRYVDDAAGFGSSRGYEFRVRDLGATFLDSHLVRFRVRLQVAMPIWFGQTTSPAGDAPLLEVDGTLQRQDGKDAYVFSLREPTSFGLLGGGIANVEVSQAEFATFQHVPATVDAPERIGCRFTFTGAFELRQLQCDPEFDVLSFATVGFSKLALDVLYETGKPTAFEFDIDPMQLEPGRSTPRPKSLAAGMPVRLNRMVRASNDMPSARGYMTAMIAPKVVPLGPDWHGIEYSLDMGTLSDVASAAGYEASLLTAWGPTTDQILVGLRLPGASGKGGLSLLGVLKLMIYSLTLRMGGGAWALLLNGINLKVFGLVLPPNGSFDFYLFGDPKAVAGKTSLGWYGAFKRNADEDAGGDDTAADAGAKPAGLRAAALPATPATIRSSTPHQPGITPTLHPPLLPRGGRRPPSPRSRTEDQ